MDDMREKVKHYYHMLTVFALSEPRYAPTCMAELAPGVVAVEDESGECDALFDKALWHFTDPNLWGRVDGPDNSRLGRAGMDVLEGVSRYPKISTIEDMVSFAKEHLSPKESHSWHDTPIVFFPT